jgi:hypothetical protein
MFISSRPDAGTYGARACGVGAMVVKPVIFVVVSTLLGPALGVGLFFLMNH